MCGRYGMIKAKKQQLRSTLSPGLNKIHRLKNESSSVDECVYVPSKYPCKVIPQHRSFETVSSQFRFGRVERVDVNCSTALLRRPFTNRKWRLLRARVRASKKQRAHRTHTNTRKLVVDIKVKSVRERERDKIFITIIDIRAINTWAFCVKY